eukprot:m.22045 g.22045  ORF g.22045 m.22045 type:complete len:66 (-) comp33445_c0_seq1:147-344(-)
MQLNLLLRLLKSALRGQLQCAIENSETKSAPSLVPRSSCIFPPKFANSGSLSFTVFDLILSGSLE